MSGNFIYVFHATSRDYLIQNNYQLIKSDEVNNIFVFINTGFGSELDGVQFILSNTLTF